MAMFLREPSMVLEARSYPGGHASSYFESGYTFDYGPHIMFSKNKKVLEFMIESLDGNVNECRRNNKVSYKKHLVKYPFENGLSELPLQDNYECLHDYIFNKHKKDNSDPKNLEEWLLCQFGNAICEKYLFPYNEKVWNIPVADLSMLWAERIPSPSVEDVIKSSLGFETEGYTHQLNFSYPLIGGYQAISEAWANRVDCKYDYRVKTIRPAPEGGYEVTDAVNPIHFQEIVSTLPLPILVEALEMEIPSAVHEAINKLIINPMLIISLGIRGKEHNGYTAMYFPESEYLVNRISFPSNFSHNNAPEGRYSIQAEITCSPGSEVWETDEEVLIDHVKSGLVDRGILADRAAIEYSSVKREEYAYVVYDVGFEERASLVRKWFRDRGIHLVGRFSFFEYVNLDGVVERALKIASELNGSQVRLEGKQVVL